MTRTPGIDHKIEVYSQPARCGAPGHTEKVVECSCGRYRHEMGEGREDLSGFITAHRLNVIESLMGINFDIKYTKRRSSRDGESER